MPSPCKVEDLSLYYDRSSPYCLNELSVGHYHNQLRNLLDIFEPDKVFILFQEKMIENISRVMKSLQMWLSITDSIPISEHGRNMLISHSTYEVINSKMTLENTSCVSQCTRKYCCLDESLWRHCDVNWCMCKQSEYLSNFLRTNCYNKERLNHGCTYVEKTILRLKYYFSSHTSSLQSLLLARYATVKLHDGTLWESPSITTMWSKYDYLNNSSEKLIQENPEGILYW